MSSRFVSEELTWLLRQIWLKIWLNELCLNLNLKAFYQGLTVCSLNFISQFYLSHDPSEMKSFWFQLSFRLDFGTHSPGAQGLLCLFLKIQKKCPYFGKNVLIVPIYGLNCKIENPFLRVSSRKNTENFPWGAF